MIALAATAAIVVGDNVALRASPDLEAPRQAVLYRGDWLEVRGERRGWLSVYDHRHERPGWIAEARVRNVVIEEASAPALRAVVEFLRETPGSESLGIAYAALYLKATKAIEPAVLGALGDMASRLAHRASAHGGPADTMVAAQLEVAESWGIKFTSLEREDGTHLCYDGEAYRYALGIGTTPDEAAKATLALTDGECTPDSLGLTERQATDEARLALVDKLDPTQVTGWLGDELRIRRAQLSSALAWSRGKRGDPKGAEAAARGALEAFLRVDKAQLADDDNRAYQEAALEVAASRWAGEAMPPKSALVTSAGEVGEMCVALAKAPLKCTHGQIWAASFRLAPKGDLATVEVEPLPGWLELWVFRRGADGGWMVDVLPPSTEGVDVGYVELAGWSPDGKRLLVVREAREAGEVKRAFQIVVAGTLAVEAQTSRFAGSGKFKQWASADWRAHTLAIR